MQLSIITINYNNANGLQKTIDSVISQNFDNYEFLVIDGASTDLSVQIIQNYENGIDYCVSEPDRGIYDAMNKGIKRAKGLYCLFLNSGDFLLHQSVLSDIFKKNPEEDILYGNLKSDTRNYIYPKTLTLRSFVNGTIPHQASLIKRELFDRFGYYEEQYRIIADWVFFLKAVLQYRVSYRRLDMYISFFEEGGISTDVNNQKLIVQQRNNVLQKFFPLIFSDYKFYETELEKLQIVLNSYRNSRLIQFVRVLQKKFSKIPS